MSVEQKKSNNLAVKKSKKNRFQKSFKLILMTIFTTRLKLMRNFNF